MRLALALLACVLLAACAQVGIGVTNAPGIPDCTPGRANCR